MAVNIRRNRTYLNYSVLLIIIIITIFVQSSCGVVRPNYFRQSNKPRQASSDATVAEEAAAAAASAEVEMEPTRDDEDDQPGYVTAQHCCKIGEYMARRSSTCRVDQPIRSNTLIKTKRRPRHQSDFSKSLQAQLSACQQHRHLIQKCCLYRRLYVRALESCEDKSSLIERIKCRWEAEEQYGH